LTSRAVGIPYWGDLEMLYVRSLVRGLRQFA
jgi:hypothetical protein